MLVLCCIGSAHLTSAWIRDDFSGLYALQIFGQPMARVTAVEALSTGSIQRQDCPFASARVNTVKGLAAAVATGVLDRADHPAPGNFHSTMLVDRLGNSPLADGDAPGLAHRLHEQAVVLTSSDLYYVMGGVAVALILLDFLDAHADLPASRTDLATRTFHETQRQNCRLRHHRICRRCAVLSGRARLAGQQASEH